MISTACSSYSSSRAVVLASIKHAAGEHCCSPRHELAHLPISRLLASRPPVRSSVTPSQSPRAYIYHAAGQLYPHTLCRPIMLRIIALVALKSTVRLSSRSLRALVASLSPLPLYVRSYTSFCFSVPAHAPLCSLFATVFDATESVAGAPAAKCQLQRSPVRTRNSHKISGLQNTNNRYHKFRDKVNRKSQRSLVITHFWMYEGFLGA